MLKLIVYGKNIANLHEELNTHRGVPIDDSNVDEVNRILKDIQEKFAQLYPAYHFIAIRHQYASNAVNFYNDFIETLKKSGAKQDEPSNIITGEIEDGRA